MDKTITTHTLQSRFDKKSGRGMPGKKIAIAHSGQVIDYFVSDHSEASPTDSLTGILKEENLPQVKEKVLKAKYISHTRSLQPAPQALQSSLLSCDSHYPCFQANRNISAVQPFRHPPAVMHYPSSSTKYSDIQP